jgi:hypothetical protein
VEKWLWPGGEQCISLVLVSSFMSRADKVRNQKFHNSHSFSLASCCQQTHSMLLSRKWHMQISFWQEAKNKIEIKIMNFENAPLKFGM